MLLIEARHLHIGLRLYDFQKGYTIVDVKETTVTRTSIVLTLLNPQETKPLILKWSDYVFAETYADLSSLAEGYPTRADNEPTSFPLEWCYNSAHPHYKYYWYGRSYNIEQSDTTWQLRTHEATTTGYATFADALKVIWDELCAITAQRQGRYHHD